MIFTDGRGGITAIVPHRIGRSRRPGLVGLEGFPWLFVGNIIVGAANAGWSYYRTKQQVQMALAQSGAAPASSEDIKMIADQMESVMGTGSRSQVENYARDMTTSSATKTQGIAPGEFFALQQRLSILEAGGAKKAGMFSNIPTWGYLALAAGAFLVVRQMGFLDRQ